MGHTAFTNAGTTHQAREPRPRNPQDATALLDAVPPAWANAASPRPTTCSTCRCPAPTPPQPGRWELVIDQPTASPVVELAGRCDTNGIDAMLDLAVAVNADTYGNVTAC